MKSLKEKKITIKPYLNTRLAPQKETYSDDQGNVTTMKGYPIYYQIIFNKNNTHIKSHYGGFYESVDSPSIMYGDPKQIIEFEKRNIERIIRYSENRQDNYQIKGFNKYFEEYCMSLHNMVNFQLKKFMLRKFGDEVDQYYWKLINYKDSSISAQFLLQMIEKLSEINTVFTVDELRKINTLKYLDLAYMMEQGISDHDKKNLNRNQIIYKPIGNNFPTYIDWLSGYAKDEIKRIINKQYKNNEIDANELITNINWILNKEQPMFP